MPALQDLRLWFDGLDVPEDHENVDGPHSSYQDSLPAVSAANYSVLQKLFNSRLPNLKRFELSNTMMPSLGFVNWLHKNGSNIEHLTFRRVGLGESPSSPSWTKLFDALKSYAPLLLSIKFACLYDAGPRALMFQAQDMSLCAICQPRWNHCAEEYCEIDCEHMSYSSNDGTLPRTQGTTPIERSSRYEYITGQGCELDETRWPVNFAKAHVPPRPVSPTDTEATEDDDKYEDDFYIENTV